MSKTEVYRVGQYVPAPVPDAAAGSGVSTLLNSGLPLRLGSLNMVTVTRKGEDNYAQDASVDLGGAHLLPVTITGGLGVFGAPVYLVTATGLLSTVSASATFFGWLLDTSTVANGTQVPCVVKVGQTGV